MLPKSFPKSTPLSPHSYLAKKKVHPLNIDKSTGFPYKSLTLNKSSKLKK